MECEEFLAEVDILELPNDISITPGFIFALHMHTILEDAEIAALITKSVVDEGG